MGLLQKAQRRHSQAAEMAEAWLEVLVVEAAASAGRTSPAERVCRAAGQALA